MDSIRKCDGEYKRTVYPFNEDAHLESVENAGEQLGSLSAIEMPLELVPCQFMSKRSTLYAECFSVLK